MKILFKKIKGHGGNAARARCLAEYVASPTAEKAKMAGEKGEQKCVFLQGFGFRGAEPDDIKGMWHELADIARIHDPRDRCECIGHYTLSLKLESGDTKPSHGILVEAAKFAMREMGYTGGTPYIIAIHDDTSHPHCHIVTSRVDRDRWRIIDEDHGLQGEFYGGWKMHCQACAAMIAQNFHWDVAPGTKFRPTGRTQTMTYTDEETGLDMTYQRPIPERVKKRSATPPPPSGALLEERRCGLVSDERQIQNAVRAAIGDYSAIKHNRAFHRALAEVGITVEKVESDGKIGLVYTNGARRVKGSAIGDLYSLPGVEKALGRRFQKGKAEDKARAEEVRASFRPTLTPEAKAESGLTAYQLEELSALPVSMINKTAPARGQAWKARPIRTALEAIVRRHGYSAVQAIRALKKVTQKALWSASARAKEAIHRRYLDRQNDKFWKRIWRLDNEYNLHNLSRTGHTSPAALSDRGPARL